MATAKTSSPLLAELRKFAATIGDLPYEKLLSTAAEAGWQTSIQQVESVGQADGTVLVTFQVFVGREDRLEPFDLLSVKVAPGPGPVSAVARRIANDSLVPLFFGRYPVAAAPPVSQPVTNIRTDDTDIVLPEDDGGEYVEDVTPERVNVIASTEPDGVPIFIDLYASGEKSNTLIEAVLDEVDNFLQRASSVEQINAMGSKNPMMIKFIKDLGTPEDSAALMDMITRRRNLVAPPVLTATAGARRRTSSNAKAN